MESNKAEEVRAVQCRGVVVSVELSVPSEYRVEQRRGVVGV